MFGADSIFVGVARALFCVLPLVRFLGVCRRWADGDLSGGGMEERID